MDLPAHQRRKASAEHGFTLIELLVVIIIIAILASIAIPTFLGARMKAQDSAAFTLVRNAVTVIESAYVDVADYTAIDAGDLEYIEPAIAWNEADSDLVDPTGPSITDGVTAEAGGNEVDFYLQDSATYDVASVSESGNKYGIQVKTTGSAQASYLKVKVLEGETTTGW